MEQTHSDHFADILTLQKVQKFIFTYLSTVKNGNKFGKKKKGKSQNLRELNSFKRENGLPQKLYIHD